MKRITFGDGNRIDEATLSGGSWMAGLPLANVQDPVIAYVARSTDAALASTKLIIDLGQARSIGVIALLGHNLSVAATARLRGASSEANLSTAPLYDSGWAQVWPWGMIPADLLEWESDNFWLGTISAEDRAAYNAPYIHLLPAASVARWWRIEIDDDGNADGYVQIGRVFISDAWTPSYNYSYGAGLNYEDRSDAEESDAGVDYWDNKPRRRSAQFALDLATEQEAMTRHLEMQRRLGKSGELLVIPDADDVVNLPRRAFVATLADLGRITHERYGVWRVSMTIREKI